jgi:hypothetical protein
MLETKESNLKIIDTYEDKYLLAWYEGQGRYGIWVRCSDGMAYQIDDDCYAEMSENGLFTYRVEMHKEEVRILMKESV